MSDRDDSLEAVAGALAMGLAFAPEAFITATTAGIGVLLYTALEKAFDAYAPTIGDYFEKASEKTAYENASKHSAQPVDTTGSFLGVEPTAQALSPDDNDALNAYNQGQNVTSPRPHDSGASGAASLGTDNKILDHAVSSYQGASKKIEKISADTTKAKTKDDKTWLSGFLNDNQLAEKTGANMANGIAGSFEGFVQKAKWEFLEPV